MALSAEGGLLSISDSDTPYINISTADDLRDAYMWLTQSAEAREYDSIALDSVSEIAEVVLNSAKQNTNDPRRAYGEMQETMSSMIRAFRDLPEKHVLFTAKLEKQQDEMQRILFYPSMPGNKMAQSLPYFFDEVLALRVERDADGGIMRMLMCDSDGLWLAKDRSGKLDVWEQPDLGAVINKISGVI